MNMICPNCYGPLQVMQEGATTQCPLHGGRYRILYSRPVGGQLAMNADLAKANDMPPPLPPKMSPTGFCYQHPSVRPAYLCSACNRPICETCAFPTGKGAQLCSNCALQPRETGWTAAASTAAMLTGAMCKMHPQVTAINRCMNCQCGICSTCQFSFPGNIYLCPACATTPVTELPVRAKRLLYGSLACAVWSTLFLFVLVTGVLSAAADDENIEMLLGLAVTVLWILPTLVGIGLVMSAFESRRKNPPLIWISLIWNGLLAAAVVLLMVLGAFA